MRVNPEAGGRSFGTGVAVSCEPHNMSARNQIQVLCMINYSLSTTELFLHPLSRDILTDNPQAEIPIDPNIQETEAGG